MHCQEYVHVLLERDVHRGSKQELIKTLFEEKFRGKC